MPFETARGDSSGPPPLHQKWCSVALNPYDPEAPVAVPPSIEPDPAEVRLVGGLRHQNVLYISLSSPSGIEKEIKHSE